MIEETRGMQEKPDTVQKFTLLLWDDHVLCGAEKLPLGQCSAEILNLSDAFLLTLRQKNEALAKAVQTQLFNSDIKKDLVLVRSVQDKLNEVLEDVVTLPPFCYLGMDKKFGQSLLIDLFQSQPMEFEQLVSRQLHERAVLQHFFRKVIAIADDAITFRTHVSTMLDFFFENLRQRNSEHYAVGVYSFFSNREAQSVVGSLLPTTSAFEFSQTREVGVEYTTMPNPENEKQYVIAERMVFDSLAAFLHVDFFRGLMHGHAPRRCHNCGRYFLLLSGHNTCYCANIAPGKKPADVNNTCRDVGAHKKETLKKEKRTPAQQEYDKVYNRLKTRKNRKKISIADWNQQVALALQTMEQNESGELSDFAYREIMGKM